MTKSIAIVSLFLAALMDLCDGACYFPPELQGEYVMQNTVSSSRGLNSLTAPEVQYSSLNVTETAIPIWGNCHRRMGNNVILVSSLGNESCFRCCHLRLKSRNVLQVLTAGKEYLYKCHTNEDTALRTCPFRTNFSSEIILYKTQDYGGTDIKKVYCPFHRKYTFTYNINDGSENNVECTGTSSYIDSCPSGSTLNLNFKQCSFQNYEMKYECMGSWNGPNNETYLALLGNHMSEHSKPHYRCALYKEDPESGIVNLALSNDSTCSSGLENSTHGFETLTLSPAREADWPTEVTHRSSCRFPHWMNGTWQHLSLLENNTLVYKDHSSFSTFTFKCVRDALGQAQEKILVFGRTQCDVEAYTCMWIVQRSSNVLEFKLGKKFNNVYAEDLCSDSNFEDVAWITQSRLSESKKSPCPVTGKYSGILPDDEGLCAKLSSNCKYPDIMYHEVSDCRKHEVREEREYKCLGQWKEGKLVYTYTQRQDVAPDTYECFVGLVVSDNEISIKDAGEHCQREMDPLHYGMRLLKNTSCDHVTASTAHTNHNTVPTTHVTTTTKLWTPDTYVPSVTVDNSGCNISFSKYCLLIVLFITFLKAKHFI